MDGSCLSAFYLLFPLTLADNKTSKKTSDKKDDDKPSDDKPLEDKPSEDKPSEDKPLEDKPLEDKSLEDKPLEDKPLEDKPLEDKPLEDNPLPDDDKPLPGDNAQSLTNSNVVPDEGKTEESAKENATDSSEARVPTSDEPLPPVADETTIDTDGENKPYVTKLFLVVFVFVLFCFSCGWE